MKRARRAALSTRGGYDEINERSLFMLLHRLLLGRTQVIAALSISLALGASIATASLGYTVHNSSGRALAQVPTRSAAGTTGRLPAFAQSTPASAPTASVSGGINSGAGAAGGFSVPTEVATIPSISVSTPPAQFGGPGSGTGGGGGPSIGLTPFQSDLNNQGLSRFNVATVAVPTAVRGAAVSGASISGVASSGGQTSSTASVTTTAIVPTPLAGLAVSLSANTSSPPVGAAAPSPSAPTVAGVPLSRIQLPNTGLGGRLPSHAGGSGFQYRAPNEAPVIWPGAAALLCLVAGLTLGVGSVRIRDRKLNISRDDREEYATSEAQRAG